MKSAGSLRFCAVKGRPESKIPVAGYFTSGSESWNSKAAPHRGFGWKSIDKIMGKWMEGKQNRNGGSGRAADCVTELRRGNTVLIVNGYFKRDINETAADKMERVLRTESDLRAIV